MIPETFINDLKQRVDIVDVIGKRISLNQAGDEYKGLCPFHKEKTPSFFVNQAKQFYHCFGCGESGNAITFLMKHGGVEFRDAVGELASSIGLDVPDESSVKGSFKSTSSETDAYDLMQRVCDAYQNKLFGDRDHPSATTYLKDRGISRETALAFGLGYAPKSWDFVLKKFGISATQRRLLEDIGLIIRKLDNEGYFHDRFRDRLMFPICDKRDHIVGFGGRSISAQNPKYMNSPNTSLFNKGSELFGLHQSKPEIIRSGQVLVVEGYTDVLALHQNGITNAVASCGTAVTTDQAKRLFDLADEIILNFDGDEAGINAASKVASRVLPEMQDGKMVSLLILPDGHDPDSMVHSNPDWYKQALSNPKPGHTCPRQPVLEYLLNIVEENVDMGRLDGRARFYSRTIDIVRNLPENGVLRQLVNDECNRRAGMHPRFVEESRQSSETDLP